MHVNWHSIKQRPHFIAENLSKSFDVNVFYYSGILEKYRVKNFNETNRANNKIARDIIIRVPYGIRNVQLYKVENWINSILFAINFDVHKFDFIWITNPRFLEFINLENIKLSGKTIIYDCMDDILEFPLVKKKKYIYQRHKFLECWLLYNADIIFTSSNELKKRLLKRGNRLENKIWVINNAVDPSTFQFEEEKLSYSMKPKRKYVDLLYFGSISDWFDMSTILNIVNIHKSIRVILVGPATIHIPRHERIFYKRPVQHMELYNYAKNVDCLIMPFKVNELITAVDPVKLYEYISLNKIIISVKYDELEKFNDFVYFYNDFGDLDKLITGIENNEIGPKYGIEEAKKFIEQNSWSSRTKRMIEVIEQYRKSDV